MRLYGRLESNDTIAANDSHITFRDEELAGYLELKGIMVIPDLDAANESHLDFCRVLVDDRQILYDMKCNYYANMLPFVTHPGKRPLALFVPSVKINKGRKFEIEFYADSTGVSTSYYVRPVGILYTDEEVVERFGIDDPTDFESLEGGINQGRSKVEPFFKYGTNESATTPGQWYEIEDLSFRIYAHQRLTITHIGVIPHANSYQLQIADIDRTLKHEYPFTITDDVNELPFGCAWQDQGPFEFPEDIRPVFQDDYVRIQIRDDGTSIPAGGVIVMVRGIWEVFE